jgi:hypothetical protein
MNSKPGSISVKPQIACSGLGNPEFSLPLFGDNQETSTRFHVNHLRVLLQLSMISNFDDNKLEFQCSNRRRNESQEKCCHPTRYNPMHKNF